MIPQFHFAPALLDKHAAAFYLSTSTRHLDTLQAQGHITPHRLGKKRVYRREDLDAYAASLDEWVGAES